MQIQQRFSTSDILAAFQTAKIKVVVDFIFFSLADQNSRSLAYGRTQDEI